MYSLSEPPFANALAVATEMPMAKYSHQRVDLQPMQHDLPASKQSERGIRNEHNSANQQESEEHHEGH